MFDIPSIRVGRVFGIPVEVNLSWFVIFALLSFSLSATVFPSLDEASGASAPALPDFARVDDQRWCRCSNRRATARGSRRSARCCDAPAART